ncbi:MAG TPA: tRNA 2-thiouridine(34) synthase MnmA [Lachnospiraceae bacterium]|nr:tRNA 2-thiouridine(34) synthase MnmA [Lachnospiraceae bacterium]
MGKKALIAMSGGVDSSVAAKLMQEEGYDCIGCNMRLYFNCGEDIQAADRAYVNTPKSCCSAEDAKDAKKVAEAMGIPFFIYDLSLEFRRCVIDKFTDCYEKGITPNPCIDCNRYMKFGRLAERAKNEGCDTIVTGHYARVVRTEEGNYLLKKALDASKDQSYVLYFLNREQLSALRLPLGELTKSRVRELAAKYGFVTADKRESQDICFVPDGDYAGVIRQYTGKEYEPGNFVDLSGKVIGTHKGIINYTIGQRKGLNIAFGKPMYVYGIIPQTNEVVLADDRDLYSDTVYVRDFSLINEERRDEIRCSAKIRYRQKEQPATLIIKGEGNAVIRFDEPQRAVTPGQAAVVYEGDTVLGGGIITLR